MFRAIEIMEARAMDLLIEERRRGNSGNLDGRLQIGGEKQSHTINKKNLISRWGIKDWGQSVIVSLSRKKRG